MNHKFLNKRMYSSVIVFDFVENLTHEELYHQMVKLNCCDYETSSNEKTVTFYIDKDECMEDPSLP